MKIVAIALCLLSGCLFVPRATTTTRELGTTEGALVYGPATGLTVAADARVDEVAVHAASRHVCVREIFAVTAATTEKHVRWHGAEDPRAGLFGVLLAPVLVPASVIVSGISVLADRDGTTTRTTRHLRTEQRPCTANAPEVRVRIVLPSGATTSGITDRGGNLALKIPEVEAYRGTVQVVAANAPAVEVPYARPIPPVTAMRDAMLACGAQHGAVGSLRLAIAIDDAGRGTRVVDDDREVELGACLDATLRTTVFSERHRRTTLVLRVELAAP